MHLNQPTNQLISKLIFGHFWATCVNSGIKIPLSLRCKILQHKIICQFPMEVQDFISLCKIHHLNWIQVDCRWVKHSELWFFRTLYRKTRKHAFRGEFILWQIYSRVFIEPSTNQDWFTCLFLLIQTKNKCCQWWKQQTIAWTRCWTTPSSCGI